MSMYFTACIGKTWASVLMKLFMNGNERYSVKCDFEFPDHRDIYNPNREIKIKK